DYYCQVYDSSAYYIF
nr:immunoglobulin light chain junction region [Macaca mulatta]MOY05524.1 immunoglobulin light chain junction region [Macaca mulatta]MOY05884.1 immunoglobulin light chain junction region [Macaca mulatta]MOY05983.1 immunoglobulin light chain junction region [Macaca mulatta]MOY06407.1 immunoglobulin light chain junction region [Macaca mulatta]